MARDIVPPPGRPDGRREPPASRTESVHPAYDAGLDPETQVFAVYPGRGTQAGAGTPVGARPGPYTQSLVPRPGRWRRRSRLLVAALGGAAAALLLIVVTGVTLSATDPAGDGTDGTAPLPAAGPYTLEAVSRSGGDVSVTYSGPDGRTATSDVPSGWTTDVPEGAGRPAFTVSTDTGDVAPRPDDTVTCRVRHDGLVIRRDSAPGAAVADCGGY